MPSCRFSDIAVLVGAGFAVGSDPRLGLAAACIAVLTAYIRAALMVAGTSSDYSGIMAKPQRMWIVVACALYMGVAPQAWMLQWGPAGDWGLLAIGLILVIIGGVITVVSRLRRGLQILQQGT